MIYLIKHYYIQTIDKRRILITSVRRILEIPGIHKSLLKEITYMWYGRRRTLLATVTSLHSGTDNGQTFSTPDNLSKTPGRSDEPQISSEGNNVYVVWTESDSWL